MAKKKTEARKENAIIRYLRNTRDELRKVHWPTREEAWSLTKIVLIVTVSMAVLLGFLDFLFAKELEGLIAGNAIAIGALAVGTVAIILAIVIVNRQSSMR